MLNICFVALYIHLLYADIHVHIAIQNIAHLMYICLLTGVHDLQILDPDSSPVMQNGVTSIAGRSFGLISLSVGALFLHLTHKIIKLNLAF